MRKLLLGAILLFSVLSFGQKQQVSLPIDSLTQKITYTNIVLLDSVNKKELYSRAREWFAKTYNSSKSVIEMDDQENGKIIGKGILDAMNGSYPCGYIRYTISIYVKDGKYKYEITNLYHEKMPTMYEEFGPCESMIKTDKKTFGISYQKSFNKILTQMNIDLRTIIDSLTLSMKTNTSTTKQKEW